MFTADDIQQRVKQRPFVPLRIVTSSGEAFEVHNPELVMIGCRDLLIGLPNSENTAIYEQLHRIALMHVTAIEDVT